MNLRNSSTLQIFEKNLDQFLPVTFSIINPGFQIHKINQLSNRASEADLSHFLKFPQKNPGIISNFNQKLMNFCRSNNLSNKKLNAFMSTFCESHIENISETKRKAIDNDSISQSIHNDDKNQLGLQDELASSQQIILSHHCFFDDNCLNHGSKSFLIRGADSAKRLLYPLEIQTNEALLPGSECAQTMFENQNASLSYAQNYIFFFKDIQKLKTFQEKTNFFSDNHQRILSLLSSLKNPVESLDEQYNFVFAQLDLIHRLLQYAVACGVNKNFIHRDLLDSYYGLFIENQIDFKHTINAVQAFKEFYSSILPQHLLTKFFLPAADEMMSLFQSLYNVNDFKGKNKLHSYFETMKNNPYEKPYENETFPNPKYINLDKIDLKSVDDDLREGLTEYLKEFRKVE